MNHQYEQKAYAEIRRALSESFIETPEEFVATFGCRPEDLSGSTLRSYYPNFLAQELEVESTDVFFKKCFYEGRIF